MDSNEFLRPEYNWAKNLKVGSKFVVYDNSFCYEILDNGTLEKTLLAKGTCTDGENPYKLYITKIGMHDFTLYGKTYTMHTVTLKSNTTHKTYICGIGWNEDCARLNGNI
jgi:hypothetical protein